MKAPDAAVVGGGWVVVVVVVVVVDVVVVAEVVVVGVAVVVVASVVAVVVVVVVVDDDAVALVVGGAVVESPALSPQAAISRAMAVSTIDSRLVIGSLPGYLRNASCLRPLCRSQRGVGCRVERPEGDRASSAVTRP